MLLDLKKFEASLDGIGDRLPDSVEYQALSGIALAHPLTPKLLELDPFSPHYKDIALDIYRQLRGGDRTYVPEMDERSALGMPENLLTGVSPWSFQDTGLVAEFLLSWGQIMRVMALAAGSHARILEYGSGSGQLLLFLARLGLHTSAVDIDAASLAVLKAQADAMQLDVRMEQAGFGEGFEGETFDRIIFFEAFHHAIDFIPLLLRLRQRLNPGGMLIFCGEPVVEVPLESVPYPWGPRLDGLSVFCIRRYGWMELGFTEAFFFQALQRTGWLVAVNRMAGCGRATAYVARPYIDEAINVGALIDLGAHEAGWEGFELSHRWTRGGGTATFPLPDKCGPSLVTIRLSNLLPVAVRVELYDGEVFQQEAMIEVGSQNVELVAGPCVGAFFGIRADGNRPADLWPGSVDTRVLGIAVHSIRVELVP